MWKGYKCELQWDDCEDQGEQMPFKNMILTPQAIFQDRINWGCGGKGDMHKPAETSIFSAQWSDANISSWSLSNR